MGRVHFGTPQLSKSKVNLYSSIMNFRNKKKDEDTRFILELLNLADGKKDLIQIANEKNFKLINHLKIIDNLLKAKFIKRK